MNQSFGSPATFKEVWRAVDLLGWKKLLIGTTFTPSVLTQVANRLLFFDNSSTNVPMGPDDNKILGGSIFHGRSKICKECLLSVLSGTIRSPNLDLGGGNLFVENKMFRIKSSFAEKGLYLCLIFDPKMIRYLCNICIKILLVELCLEQKTLGKRFTGWWLWGKHRGGSFWFTPKFKFPTMFILIFFCTPTLN